MEDRIIGDGADVARHQLHYSDNPIMTMKKIAFLLFFAAVAFAQTTVNLHPDYSGNTAFMNNLGTHWLQTSSGGATTWLHLPSGKMCLNTDNGYVYVWNDSTATWTQVTTTGTAAIYGLVPAQIHGGDTVGVNLVAGSGITISAGATADTIIGTSSGLTQLYAKSPVVIAGTDTATLPVLSIAGTHNTNLGFGANGSRTSGSYNVCIGDSADYKDTSGSYNVAIAPFALYSVRTSNVHGDSNIAIGFQSLFANALSGKSAQAPGENVSIGINAMYSDTASNHCVAIGDYAGQGMLTRDDVVVIGDHAAYNADKMNVVAVGYYALYTMGGIGATDPDVVAIGYRSLYNATGTANTAVGWNSAESETGGNYNTAIGSSALYGIGATYSGNDGTAVGANALAGVTTGGENTGIGSGAGAGITTGSNNTSLGSTAGQNNNTTGSNNTCIGYNANTHFSTSNPQDRTALGANSDVTTDSTVQLGDAHLQFVNTVGTYKGAAGLILHYRALNGTNTIAATDYFVTDSTNASTLHLPSTPVSGQIFCVKFNGATGESMTLDAGGTTKIDNGTSVTLSYSTGFSVLSGVTVIGDGTQYWIIGAY
ncbi:MAG: hypothetical protein KGJ13_02190 [Patescibacteria group bacterium]|nr:hypothetical protein [Patescibacteria group bacterium]